MWVSALDVYTLAGQYNAFDTTLTGIRVDDGILDFYFSAVDYGEGYEYAGPFLNAMVIEQDSIFSLETGPDIILREGQIDIFENYPNPFNPSTTISVELDNGNSGTIVIYNVNGQVVKTLHNGYINPGLTSFQWDGNDQAGLSVSGGTYIYRLLIDGYTQSQKMVLLK